MDFNNDKSKILIQECLLHAEDLLRGSKRILETEKLPNISFHLALLALEEIGKTSLIHAHQSISSDSNFANKMAEDHVRKIFWALWSPSIGHDLITRDQIQKLEGMADTLHEKRLRGLYMPLDGEGFTLPRNSINAKEVEQIIELTTARLEYQKSFTPKILNESEKKDMNCFIESTKIPEKRKYIFGGSSMKMLAELKSVAKWMHWLRVEYETQEERSKAFLAKELSRQKPTEQEAGEPKWQMKIRVLSDSHSIRGKSFNWWNDTVNWIKLTPVNKKKEILVEITIPKGVPINGVWWTGLAMARHFITALNIGSLGYFWWYLPEQKSRYYERIIDLETGGEVGIDQTPHLKIDWGRKEPLTDDDLRRVATCFSMLPKSNQKILHGPYNHYLTGLGFLSKTDIHMSFAANAFEEFYNSFKNALIIYEDWDQSEPFKSVFQRFGQKVFNEEVELEKLYILGEEILKAAPTEKITLKEAGEMKILCDSYFLGKLFDLAKQRAIHDDEENEQPNP